MTILLTVIYTVLMFVILIVPHEFGHFITAKSVGVQVNEFSFGMGPKIFQKTKGETTYSVRALPIGGYCAMEGENEESENPRAFNNKPVWAKILVLVAGAFMNVLTAVLILTIMIAVSGMATTTIGGVQKGSPAASAGFKAGDEVVEVSGHKISEWADISSAIGTKGEELTFTVKRGSSEKNISVTPEKKDGRYVIGITAVMTHDPFKALKYGSKISLGMIKLTYKSFGMLFTGEAGVKDMSGPVGMVSLVNQTATAGFSVFLYLTAFLCMNLAVVNMMPFPALDGGRVVMVIIRKITGHMITDDMEGKINLVGLAALLTLMIFVTWNDISRIFLK
ncbi:MAG: RIP metalloprotease RseP [Eubacteriales bacterium]|nr:RIP metalloprotease RseP [Eubacteriales bacterium]